MLKTRYKLPDSILFTKSNHMNYLFIRLFFVKIFRKLNDYQNKNSTFEIEQRKC